MQPGLALRVVGVMINGKSSGGARENADTGLGVLRLSTSLEAVAVIGGVLFVSEELYPPQNDHPL